MILNLESSEHVFSVEPEQNSVTIGREPTNELILKVEGVSRKHARLSFEEGQWLVEDLESKHGSTLNNRMINKPTALNHGDVLRLAGVVFMVTLSKDNEMGTLGRKLAGGAREQLKMINEGNKAAAKRPLHKPLKSAAARKSSVVAAAAEDVVESSPAGETVASIPAPASNASDEDAPKRKSNVMKKKLGGAASRTGRAVRDVPAKSSGGGLKVAIAVVAAVVLGVIVYFGFIHQPVEATTTTPAAETPATTPSSIPAVPPTEPASAPTAAQ